MNTRTITLFLVLSILLAAATNFAEEPGAKSAGQKRSITLNMKKGEISDALRLVAEQGGLNLVIGPEVKGEVSVYLTDASLDTALKAIAMNNGFNYKMDEDVITVAKASDKSGPGEVAPATVTTLFTLRSQDAERVKDALEFALSKWGKMKVLNQNSQGGYGVQRLSSLGGEVNGTNGAPNSAGYGNGSNGNNQNVLGGLSSGPAMNNQPPQGQDQARNARTLVVTDTPESVERIGKLISDLDRLPPQVLIEARIVEMSTDLQRQLGIDWNLSVLANGPILNHEWPIRNRAGFASGDQIRRSFDGTPFQSSGLALGSVDFSQLTALVRANQSDAAIRLLANPRLLVYNNHSASILVGERYPILQANISNFGTATESLQTYIPVGVQLEVTPTIMMDGTISMLVHPATSALGDDVIGTTGLHVARIRTRELDTRVIMRDGQTIVLGGLISDRKTHQANKVPGLGDIPILDVIFRQENPRADRVDLLVFLTAHVESATEISERDQRVFDMYKPSFKHVERLQDVPLHFEIPTEYENPKPMFSDPQDPRAYEPDDEPTPTTQPTTTKPRPVLKEVHPMHKAAASAAPAQRESSTEEVEPAETAAPTELGKADDTAPAGPEASELEEDGDTDSPKSVEPARDVKGLTQVRAGLKIDGEPDCDDGAADWWTILNLGLIQPKCDETNTAQLQEDDQP